MTIEEINSFLFGMVTELMSLMPSLPYSVILNFNWKQLRQWHTAAIKNYKALNGIK